MKLITYRFITQCFLSNQDTTSYIRQMNVCPLGNRPISFPVIISRQQRRMQVMRIRQRDDRYRNKKKKKQQQGSSHHNQAKQLNAEPAYRRKPNPIRRYDTDVLSPVATIRDVAFFGRLNLKM